MPYFDDDNDMSQYSQVNVMAAYVSMIRFAMDKLELHLMSWVMIFFLMVCLRSPWMCLVMIVCLLGILIRGILTMMDEFGSLARAGCDCDDCRCGNDKDGNRANRLNLRLTGLIVSE
jgi:hypothetical protein